MSSSTPNREDGGESRIYEDKWALGPKKVVDTLDFQECRDLPWFS